MRWRQKTFWWLRTSLRSRNGQRNMPQALRRNTIPKLTLLHVVNPKELEHCPDPDRIVQALEAKLQALLGPEASVPCTLRIESGRVVPAVLHTAEELEADVLVVGVRPALPVLSRFMWPNASEIVRESPCPVLTVAGAT